MPGHIATLLAVMATVSSSSLVTAGSADLVPPAEPCFGQVPTIVGVPGGTLEGTEGADVVVTNGAFTVDTLGGDDLVCIRRVPKNPTGSPYAADLRTGAGRDRVDNTEGKAYFHYYYTSLGEGEDEYVGGLGRDTVYGGDMEGPDADPDVIATHGGKDVVVGSASDVIDLGRGADHGVLVGDATGAVVDGGSGLNALAVDFVNQERASWAFDNRAEVLLRDEQPVARWHDFVHFQIAARGRIAFAGSAVREKLEFTRECCSDQGWISRWPSQLRMGAGADELTFRGGAAGSLFDGGPGTDKFRYERSDFTLETPAAVLLDLASGAFRDVQPGRVKTRQALRFESACVLNPLGSTTLKGTAQSNALRAFCARGVGTMTPAAIYGRGGDDALAGSAGDDLLVGGLGDDVARGGGGEDRCVAEGRLCER